MIKTIKVKIKGRTPLLMNRFSLAPIEALDKRTPAEQAELVSYCDEHTGELFLPAVALQRSLVNGAKFLKGKGRASLQKVAAACLLVSPDRLMLGTKNYEIDSRAVVVPSTRGRIVRHRPRIDNWQAAFDLDYDDVLLSEEQVREIVDIAGDRVGVLDFRPERNGPFGRYYVVEWTPV